MNKIVPLNLVITYPVYWDKYKIFRDFIQNFYDSIGFSNWNKLFEYKFTDNHLILTAKERTFNYQWLIHIGASTKTQNDKNTAGYFGEGFKIASLCALRDYNWTVTMSSDDWNIKVITTKTRIDNYVTEMLAYDFSSKSKQNKSELDLFPITENDIQIFEAAIHSFYYPENKLFGEKIFENENYAVYNRSNETLPNNYPFTYKFGKTGIIFCAYQALGSIPIPFILCKHNYKNIDREREVLEDYDVLKVFYQISENIDSNTAVILLSSLNNYWNSYPKKSIDIHTWYYVICELIRRISNSEQSIDKFKKEYPNLIYANRLYRNEIVNLNKRKQAKTWLRNSSLKKFKLVQENFKLLGYPELETLCEESNGFVKYGTPTKLEQEYINILCQIANKIFKEFFYGLDNIKYEIIRNEYAVYNGMALSKIISKKIFNSYRLEVKRNLKVVYIKEKFLNKDSFDVALSIYLHELSHMFGGDSSSKFSLSLTYIAEILIRNSWILNEYREKWITIGENLV